MAWHYLSHHIPSHAARARHTIINRMVSDIIKDGSGKIKILRRARAWQKFKSVQFRVILRDIAHIFEKLHKSMLVRVTRVTFQHITIYETHWNVLYRSRFAQMMTTSYHMLHSSKRELHLTLSGVIYDDCVQFCFFFLHNFLCSSFCIMQSCARFSCGQ